MLETKYLFGKYFSSRLIENGTMQIKMPPHVCHYLLFSKSKSTRVSTNTKLFFESGPNSHHHTFSVTCTFS